METIVVSGAVAQLPGRGGHTWAFLQYLLGFRRLGWDVVFVDSLNSEMCDGPSGAVWGSPNSSYLHEVMESFGLDDRYALIDRSSGTVIGMSRRELFDRVRGSAAIINVMGYLDDEELLAAAPTRVFLDIDPGFPQMWRALGLADLFAGHDIFVTIAQRIAADDCTIPSCGLDWVTTPQPVVLEQWRELPLRAGSLTTIATWRGPNGPVEYDGATYGLRVHEFRRFLELPSLTASPLELALDIDPADERDLRSLRDHGWSLVDPAAVAGDPWSYREYIAAATGEFAVAKSMYVQTRGGWFSDRSICFLATGRPVIAQDTGIKDLYPVGDGLLVYSDLDGARAAVEQVTAEPRRHGRAARDLAEAYFDSDKVLSELLHKLRIG